MTPVLEPTRAEIADLETHEAHAPVLAPPRRRTGRRVVLVSFVSFVAFMVLGNVVIFVASLVAQSTDTQLPLVLSGIHNGRIVDDTLWRGGAPSDEGYRSLAAAGVDVVVDLRAEDDLHVDEGALRAFGLRRVHIPIRDGQRPTAAQVDRFMELMASQPGLVYVHCGAGVGRTGAMVAAYRVLTGAATGQQAVRDNLAVGPPSLEQLSYAANATGDAPGSPNPVLIAASRVLDAPRRLLSYRK